ncbi:hypothetical protein FGB62_12g413 [Gracilaria domingensis]|nr:hypothetical protein FGB62_12g413 [Gracilaria domingensis]
MTAQRVERRHASAQRVGGVRRVGDELKGWWRGGRCDAAFDAGWTGAEAAYCGAGTGGLQIADAVGGCATRAGDACWRWATSDICATGTEINERGGSAGVAVGVDASASAAAFPFASEGAGVGEEEED